MNDYSDIINLPYHQPKVHPQMSMHDRAPQFSPFAALTGYDDVFGKRQIRHCDRRGDKVSCR